MRNHAFCYYHAGLHSNTKRGFADNYSLPIPEDSAAIQESLGTLFQAILSSSVDQKKTAQLLWGLQIASNNLARKPKKDPDTVPSVTRTKDGVDLAPVLNVCDPIIECRRCEKAETCDRFFDFDGFMGYRKPDSDETGEDAGKPAARPPCENEEDETIDVDEDRRPYAFDCDDDEDDEKEKKEDDEEIDGKALINSFRISRQLDKTLEREE